MWGAVLVGVRSEYSAHPLRPCAIIRAHRAARTSIGGSGSRPVRSGVRTIRAAGDRTNDWIKGEVDKWPNAARVLRWGDGQDRSLLPWLS
jgi:hypothetical protein